MLACDASETENIWVWCVAVLKPARSELGSSEQVMMMDPMDN